MKKIKTLIIGSGAAGLTSGIFSGRDSLIISSGHGNSIISPWNCMLADNLKEKMLKSGISNNKKIVSKFIENIPEAIEFLKKNFEIKKSNIGVIPNSKRPGIYCIKKLEKIYKNKGGKVLKGSVTGFLKSRNEIFGVLVKHEKKIKKIFFDNLIIASGGISDLFKYSTGPNKGTEILSLLHAVGILFENIEFQMFHPFLIIDEKMPRVLVSGEILSKMKYVSEGKEFLSEEIKDSLKNNEHHSIFPKMINEFYFQSIKSDIYGILEVSEEWFRKYKKENEFGWIFSGKELGNIKKIKISPAYHYLVGGIKINERCETSLKNVFACGEVSSGLHGFNRIGGLAIPECIVFGKIAAECSSETENRKTPSSLEKIIIQDKISNELKEKLWFGLGPVRNNNNLKNFLEYLNYQKGLIPEFVKMITKISLNRKESVGCFLRDDYPLPNNIKKSYLQGNNFWFE